MTTRDELLDKMLSTAGAAEKLREGAEKAKEVLDEAGVEHKALELKSRSVELTDRIFAIMSGEGDEAAKREQIMQLLDGEMPREDVPEDASEGEMMKEYATKQTQLLDQLIVTQADLVTYMDNVDKAVKALAPMNSLAQAFKTQTAKITELETTVKALGAQLAARPRAASTATETVNDDPALAEKARKDATTRDPFWGVEVRK